MSAPAFGTIGTKFGSATSTPSIAVPASVASGDIIVVKMWCDVATTTISTRPSGFAAAENSPRTVNSGGAGNFVLHVEWKRATGADTGTYDFTLSGSVFVYGEATRYTGCVAAGNPWDSPTNAADGGATASTTTPDVAVTTLGPDRLLVFAGGNINGDGGTWTVPSGFSERLGGVNNSNLETSDKVQAAQGGSGNVHATNTSSDKVGAWLGALIGTTVSSIPWSPQRSAQPRDPGEAWWLQRERRDANTVATAANPLVAPLDSAWQSGGGYWHLYNDAADAAPRTWQSLQRSYVSDPALLAPAGTDPLGMPTGPAGDIAAYWDRREVPQQRPYASPVGLLDTALLEAELLGGADTAKRAGVPASHADRREVPQQRVYLSTPGQLDTAQLENELLGGADTSKRAGVAATHAPRWWAPQQPEREALSFDAGPDVPPLTLSWGAGGRYWALYNQAGWQPDRREVPQQRPYVSDPSFYPTVPPLDPLTVAWGASGPYWLLYNTAALQVGRRLAPQQRERESDPGLLLTALLEAELLGGADDLARHRHAAVYTDRREAPQQRVYDDPALLATALLEGVLLGGGDLARHTFAATLWDRRETPAQRPYGTDPALYGADADPLLLAGGVGGDAWRRSNTAVYGDRRQVPGQPPRSTVYFDAGPGSPPLTISWGAGGHLWHLYNHAADLVARVWWPQQRPYLSNPLFPPANATSTATVVAVVVSTSAVTGPAGSVSAVTGPASSTATVSDG